MLCLLGETTTNDGSTSCSLCSIGRYGSNPGNCTDCPFGKYSSDKGKISCSTCSEDGEIPNDEEEQDVLDNLREQYGRSENLIVSRFAKVCNERNDHLEDLKSQKLIAQSELDKRNNFSKHSRYISCT